MIWKRLRFLHKVSIRNILRYKKRMIMMIIGIGGCTALLLTGFGIRDTIRPLVDRQYGEISLYDATVSFHHAPDTQEREMFLRDVGAYARDAAFVYSGSAQITGDFPASDVELVVYEGDISAFTNLHYGKEAVAWPGVGEIVLNYRIAKENGISVGDEISISDGLHHSMTVTVKGIYDNYIYDVAYLSAETCARGWGYAPDANMAYLTFYESQDDHAAGAFLLNREEVASVTIISDLKDTVSHMLENMDYIVLIVLVCAGALAFIVLCNLTNITITERTREIATLKVLGFYTGEQNSYVFRENIILTSISALCGIPLGIALLHYTMSQIKIGTFYFGCSLSATSYVWAVGLTILFTIFVDWMLTAKIKHINMTEALKAIE